MWQFFCKEYLISHMLCQKKLREENLLEIPA